jgi:hypothetical protein
LGRALDSDTVAVDRQLAQRWTTGQIPRAKRWASFALAVPMAFGAMAAAAHSTDEDHGELTFYDERDREGHPQPPSPYPSASPPLWDPPGL